MLPMRQRGAGAEDSCAAKKAAIGRLTWSLTCRLPWLGKGTALNSMTTCPLRGKSISGDTFR